MTLRRLLVASAASTVACALVLACGPGAHALGAQSRADSMRGELAVSYWRLDRLATTVPDGPARAALNRAFDRTTLAFFGGRFAEAIGTMDSLAASLASPARVTALGDSARARLAVPTPAGGERPLVVHVPARLPAVGAPPLVIALHGAGGDERMFRDAYGAGALIRLADSLGFIVASPLANGFTPAAFDSVLTRVAAMQAFDTSRVYVIGHSMGAGFAAQLADARGGKLRAVACIAGGRPLANADGPPVLFIGAGLDPIIPAARVEAAATASADRATYRVFPDEGHTLLVGRALPDAISWLFRAGGG